MRFFLALAAGLLFPTAAQAQAFGIDMGTSIAFLDVDLEESISLSSHSYVVRPPNPNGAFDVYIVSAPLETGVCLLFAYSDSHSLEENATYFSTLGNALVTLYGTPDSGVEGNFLGFSDPPSPYSEIIFGVDGARLAIAYRYENFEQCVRYTDTGAGL